MSPAAAMEAALPEVRGRLAAGRPMSELTWMRVGGPADWLFRPADEADLAAFLAALDPRIPVFPLGAGSNLIVRDGGMRGVVIRLGREFGAVRVDGARVAAAAAAPDARVAAEAAAAGIDLTFLRTIPGCIGGAARMNAGCYGTSFADAFVSARAVTREGRIAELGPEDMEFGYRRTGLPADWVIVEAVLEGPRADPAALNDRMRAQLRARAEAQPSGERCAGSAFRNPSGRSSAGAAGESHDLAAWKLVDGAGMRGAWLGGAQVSEKHPNFLLNAADATADDLERLGEKMRKKVLQTSGITLEWEIMRVGEPTR